MSIIGWSQGGLNATELPTERCLSLNCACGIRPAARGAELKDNPLLGCLQSKCKQRVTQRQRQVQVIINNMGGTAIAGREGRERLRCFAHSATSRRFSGV